MTMTANEYPWKQTLAGQPRVGARAERRRTTSMRDVEMFTEMTGDKNPITMMPTSQRSLPLVD